MTVSQSNKRRRPNNSKHISPDHERVVGFELWHDNNYSDHLQAQKENDEEAGAPNDVKRH